MAFAYQDFLPPRLFAEINTIKTFQPHILRGEWQRRRPLDGLPPHLVLAAADHNARMINAYQGNPLGLANRHEYLSRLGRMLCSDIQGLEAAPDVMEDVLLLNYLLRRDYGVDFLDGKALIGTLNRGGLKDSVWELDDFCSCYTPQQAVDNGLDGLKFMLRIAPHSPLSRHTLEYCAHATAQAAQCGLPIFIEVLYIREGAAGPQIAQDLDSLCQSIGVAAALGGSSAQKWLELPICQEYGQMAASTTCSILVVPDEREQQGPAVAAEYAAQIASAPQVRGILLGRNVLYNQEEDPYVLAQAIHLLWAEPGLTAQEAYRRAQQQAPASVWPH